ncbi:MAG: type II toxin-antitoxin system RelE/ParE family toxin [Clostridia bacterium]|nr:type II toxin-antitoxin system RelE/ParE family toxin [Clostridia bacterium]
MKKYKVEYSVKAIKQLKKMDKYTRSLIYAWIDKNLQGCENPRIHGKTLVENRSGQWRYRIGDYRVICEIKDNEIIILVLEIGHKKEIYNKKYKGGKI